MPVFFLPYLLTLEKTLGTDKWLRLTPTRPWATLLAKVALALLLSLGISGVCLLAFGGSVTLAGLGGMLATTLTSTLIFTLLSLLLGNFAAVVLTFIWSTVAPMLLALLPNTLREPVAAALPGLDFNHWGGPGQGVRMAAAALYAALTGWLVWKQQPKW